MFCILIKECEVFTAKVLRLAWLSYNVIGDIGMEEIGTDKLNIRLLWGYHFHHPSKFSSLGALNAIDGTVSDSGTCKPVA